METRVMVLVVGLFGLMSAVLGFMAEAKKLTPADIHVSGTKCVYPASPAHSLAVGAILLLVVSQIITSVASSCCGRCRRGGDDDASKKSSRPMAGVLVFVLSWIAALIAVVFYWIGASMNAAQTRDVTSEEECFYLKDGVFSRGSVLTLVATSFAIMSCVLLRAPAATAEPEAGAAEFRPESGVV